MTELSRTAFRIAWSLAGAISLLEIQHASTLAVVDALRPDLASRAAVAALAVSMLVQIAGLAFFAPYAVVARRLGVSQHALRLGVRVLFAVVFLRGAAEAASGSVFADFPAIASAAFVVALVRLLVPARPVRARRRSGGGIVALPRASTHAAASASPGDRVVA
jgi:hypothetical protein